MIVECLHKKIYAVIDRAAVERQLALYVNLFWTEAVFMELLIAGE